MPTQNELLKSYKKKLYHKHHHLITDEERAANTAYHKERRQTRTPEQEEAAKLSTTKYSIKKRLRKAAETYVRQQGFDTQAWDNAFDKGGQ